MEQVFFFSTIFLSEKKVKNFIFLKKIENKEKCFENSKQKNFLKKIEGEKKTSRPNGASLLLQNCVTHMTLLRMAPFIAAKALASSSRASSTTSLTFCKWLLRSPPWQMAFTRFSAQVCELVHSHGI